MEIKLKVDSEAHREVLVAALRASERKAQGFGRRDLARRAKELLIQVNAQPWREDDDG